MRTRRSGGLTTGMSKDYVKNLNKMAIVQEANYRKLLWLLGKSPHPKSKELSFSQVFLIDQGASPPSIRSFTDDDGSLTASTPNQAMLNQAMLSLQITEVFEYTFTLKVSLNLPGISNSHLYVRCYQDAKMAEVVNTERGAVNNLPVITTIQILTCINLMKNGS